MWELLLDQEQTLSPPIIAAIAALTAALVAATGTTISPIIANVFSRRLDRSRSKKIIVDEIEDIIRHCQANFEILANMNCSHGTPARMHFDKMIMFETALIFDNNLARDLPLDLRRRTIWIRLVVRNLNKEIQDTISYCYGKKLRSSNELKIRVLYMKDKFEYAQERLMVDLLELEDVRVTKRPSRSKEIIYISEPYE